jgi:hypothetical protein
MHPPEECPDFEEVDRYTKRLANRPIKDNK